MLANTLRVAQADLDAVERLHTGKNRYAVYHCEQAAEKIIKIVHYLESAAPSRFDGCFLLQQHPNCVATTLEMKYELFGRCVAISGDGDVDISGRPRLGARRDCEAANECTRRTRVVELREDALQCAFDRVQRRGHAAGIPTASPNSAPGRRAYQAPTRSSSSCSEISGNSRRSRWRSMRSATSINANVMRSFSVGVSWPDSDIS